MFGVPFEGYDYYRDGKGGMRGVIAKLITLFDQTGSDMDKACLVTYLSEAPFAPAILLQKFVSLEEIDEYHVKATISFEGQTASGVFSFNERYEYVSFTTHERCVSNPDGSVEYVPWSALCEDYVTSESGIRYPSKFKAVWNYEEGDFIYFDGVISKITLEAGHSS